MIKRTFVCSKDAFLNQPNQGNGRGNYLVVGPTSGDRNRVVLQFDANWAGGFSVAEALLDLTVDDGCFTQGPNVALHVKRIPNGTTFLEGNKGAGGDSCGAFTDNGVVYPGPTTVATHQVDYNPGVQPVTGQRVSIDLTAMVQDCFADGDSSVRVMLLAGTVAAANEDNANNLVVFASSEQAAGVRPALQVRLVDNRAPTAPTVTMPESVAGTPPKVASYSGGLVPVTWVQHDADRDDYTAARQHQFYASSATDGTPGTPLKDVTIDSPSRPVRGTDEVSTGQTRRQMRERSRTRDNHGAWGAWSSLADALIQTAYKPRQPSNPYFQNTTTTSPVIAGSINSADPLDTVSGYEVEVYKDQVAGGSITMWAPGRLDIGGSPTRAQVTYGGLTINVGDKLRWRHRIYNRDNVPGDWSPFMYRTFYASTGPTAMSPTDTSTKQLSRTPTLTIADAANFDRYQWRLYRAGALIYDSGVTSIASTNSTGVAVPSGYANWGDLLTWDAAIRHTGNSALEAFSPQYSFYIDTLPSTTLAVSA